MLYKYLKQIAVLLLMVIFSQATVFAYEKKEYPRVKNLSVDTFGEKYNDIMLRWEYDGDYVGAEVYKVDASGELTLLGTTQNLGYAYKGGTYLVKAVNAAENDYGSIISFSENMTFSLVLNKADFYKGSACFDVSVKNNNSEYAGGVLDIHIYDIDGNTISQTQSGMVMKGGTENNVRISQLTSDKRYKVVLSFWDSISSKHDSAEPITILKEAPSADYVQGVIDINNANAAEILGLIDECAARNIPTDYEYASYKIMDKFSRYLNEDMDSGELNNIYYTENALNKIYEEAKINLKGYLSGEKNALSTPKYTTGQMKINGGSVYASSHTDGADSGERPMYFYGYGHLYNVMNDIEFFEDIGMNTIQIEIGPSNTMLYTPYFEGWGVTESENASYTAKQDTSEFQEGIASAKITASDGSVAFYQKVAVTPGKKYTLSAKVKYSDASNIYVSANGFAESLNLHGNSGWRTVEQEFTAPEGIEYTTVGFKVSGAAELWVDNVSFTVKKGSDNLLKNAGFETVSDLAYTFDPYADKVAEIRSTLKKAEENNIAVCVLLSPHYFPEKIIEMYDIGLNKSGAFLKYNINAPEAKAVVERFMRGIIPIVNEYSSLNSLCLSNEPSFELTKSGDYYYQEWRELLKKKYDNDINKLNAVYRQANPNGYVPYNSFDEVEYKHVSWYYMDYVDLNNGVFSRWHKWMADIAKETAPNIPVHSKIMNYLQGRSYDALINGTNYQYYDFMDLNGCDSGAILDEDKKYLQEVLWYDYTRSIKDAPIINSEDHLIANGSKDYDAYVADYVSSNVYMGAIHGRVLGNMWVWERSYDETSDFNGSILFRPDVISAVSKTTMDLNRNAYYIKALAEQKAEVGILYSDTAVQLDKNEKNSLYQAYAASVYNGKNVRFIVPSQLEKMNEFKVVIVPDAQYVTAETLTALSDYIKNGGKVIMMGDKCLKYDDMKVTNNSATVAEIYKNSDTVEYVALKNGILNVTESKFYSDIRDLFKKYGLYCVEVRDTATGEPVNYVEYGIGVYNGKLIVNLANYEKEKTVNIYINDQLVTTARNIITNENVSEKIKLSRFVPVTLEIEADREIIEQLSE